MALSFQNIIVTNLIHYKLHKEKIKESIIEKEVNGSNFIGMKQVKKSCQVTLSIMLAFQANDPHEFKFPRLINFDPELRNSLQHR
jgi:hypothetical protein